MWRKTTKGLDIAYNASEMKAHNGQVLAICTSKEKLVYSGGIDGVVNIWEFGSHFKLIKKYSVDIQDNNINSVNFKIRAIDELKYG